MKILEGRVPRGRTDCRLVFFMAFLFFVDQFFAAPPSEVIRPPSQSAATGCFPYGCNWYPFPLDSVLFTLLSFLRLS